VVVVLEVRSSLFVYLVAPPPCRLAVGVGKKRKGERKRGKRPLKTKGSPFQAKGVNSSPSLCCPFLRSVLFFLFPLGLQCFAAVFEGLTRPFWCVRICVCVTPSCVALSGTSVRVQLPLFLSVLLFFCAFVPLLLLAPSVTVTLSRSSFVYLCFLFVCLFCTSLLLHTISLPSRLPPEQALKIVATTSVRNCILALCVFASC
jgi:hypothetical protein